MGTGLVVCRRSRSIGTRPVAAMVPVMVMAMIVGMIVGIGAVPAGAAASVTVEVRGVVDVLSTAGDGFGFDSSGTIAIGDPFVATFTIDAAAFASGEGNFPDTVQALSLSVGTYTAAGDASAPNGVNIQDSAGSETLQLVSGSPLAGGTFGAFAPYGLIVDLIDIATTDSVFNGSVPTGALDVASFPDRRQMNLSFRAPCVGIPASGPAQLACRFMGYLPANVVATVDALVVGGSADADGDGVVDDIDTGNGTFDDGAGTFGAIVLRAGLDVVVEDAATGVQITVTGSGGPARVRVCGFDVDLVAGTSAVVTCGSITVSVATGRADIVLDPQRIVSVPAGSQATVAAVDPGGFRVTNTGPSGTTISMSLAGVTTAIASGDPARTTAPTTTRECKHGGWRSYGVYRNEGVCVRSVAAGR